MVEMIGFFLFIVLVGLIYLVVYNFMMEGS